MVAYSFDRYNRWNGDDGGNDLTLDSPGAINSAPQTATDGSGTEEWTLGEEIISVPFFNSGGSAANDDATFIGTVTGASGRLYPVFYDTNTYYWVFYGGNDAIAVADAIAMRAAGTATVTPQTFQACFAEGTQITCADGDIAVEALLPGDVVRTADGRQVPVKWVGYQHLFPSALALHMQPVRIRAGALGAGLPRADLVLTADHAVYLDGYLVNAGALVNGDTIDFVPLGECGFSLKVFHVELQEHEVILANGLPSESYLDQPSRQCFDNFDDYTASIGVERSVSEMPVPRIAARRMLPMEIRARVGFSSSVPSKVAAA